MSAKKQQLHEAIENDMAHIKILAEQVVDAIDLDEYDRLLSRLSEISDTCASAENTAYRWGKEK